MTGAFHITAKGEIGRCTARIKCPLGGEHFDNPEDARAALERILAREHTLDPMRNTNVTEIGGKKFPSKFSEFKDYNEFTGRYVGETLHIDTSSEKGQPSQIITHYHNDLPAASQLQVVKDRIAAGKNVHSELVQNAVRDLRGEGFNVGESHLTIHRDGSTETQLSLSLKNEPSISFKVTINEGQGGLLDGVKVETPLPKPYDYFTSPDPKDFKEIMQDAYAYKEEFDRAFIEQFRKPFMPKADIMRKADHNITMSALLQVPEDRLNKFLKKNPEVKQKVQEFLVSKANVKKTSDSIDNEWLND